MEEPTDFLSKLEKLNVKIRSYQKYVYSREPVYLYKSPHHCLSPNSATVDLTRSITLKGNFSDAKKL